MLMGIRRVTESNRLQNLAVRNIIVSNSTPSGNKLVGIHKVTLFGFKAMGAESGDGIILGSRWVARSWIGCTKTTFGPSQASRL
eukprot:1155034-Pelagomonas_calceolata.AAC.2